MATGSVPSSLTQFGRVLDPDRVDAVWKALRQMVEEEEMEMAVVVVVVV